MTPLYAHQQEVVDRNEPKLILSHSTGTGKTRTALELAKKNNVHALVVCPKSLKEKWGRDIMTWGASADVVSKEEFKRDYKKLRAYEAVIIDEVHAGGFANFKSQMHKVASAYFKAHNVRYRWLLSATPYCSTPWNIYSLLRLIDVKEDYWHFRNKYFTERYFGNRVVFVPRNGIEDEIADLVRAHGSVVRLDECVDVPDQRVVEEFFDLTKEQKDLLSHVKLNEQNPLARFSKYHQIASGTLLGNEFTETVRVKANKNDYIMSIVQKNDKVIVFCRYNAHIDMLAEALEKQSIPYRVIRGDVKDRDSAIRDGEEAKRMVMLINTSCSTGYELPSFPICIFASLSYSYTDFIQCQGRVLRINKVKKNLYIICITKDSADVPVLESIRRKESFSEAIYTQNTSNEAL